MRSPVKVGIAKSLIRCNPEGVRRKWLDPYDNRCRMNQRNWKSFRRCQWKVEENKGTLLSVATSVDSIRNPEYQEQIDRLFPTQLIDYSWERFEDWVPDDEFYTKQMIADVYVNDWDTQEEEEGLRKWTYAYSSMWPIDWDEVYEHESLIFEYEYRDTFIDDGEYFGAHGWDFCSLINYEKERKEYA